MIERSAKPISSRLSVVNRTASLVESIEVTQISTGRVFLTSSPTTVPMMTPPTTLGAARVKVASTRADTSSTVKLQRFVGTPVAPGDPAIRMS